MSLSPIQSLTKFVRALMTSPPHTWYRRWKQRNIKKFTSREDYLKTREEHTDNELLIGGQEIMQDWERPVMKALAEAATGSSGHVLEVGFGMGISAGYLIEAGCSEYTIIEPHPDVLKRLNAWRDAQPVPVNIVEGFWEEVIGDLGVFDGVLFDTYPVTEEEAKNNTLIQEFVPHASKHLRAGGVFTFYGSFPRELPKEDMDLLRQHFSEVRITTVTGLKPPPDCLYYQESEMLVPVCVK